jgi:methyl-accepting chemotaxis protein
MAGSQSLAELSEDLKNSTDVAKSAEEVASAAEQLSSAVQEITRSGAQIMAALDQILKGAQVQSAGTEEVAAAISQIEKGTEVAQKLGKTSGEKVTAIQTLLDINKKSIDGLITGISLSVDASRDSLKQIKELELVSRRIDKIVDAITTVSIQTNMLAVNGSIEAARAGEFGKGFVVVATDIRNLAHDSAENADRIKDLVRSVQDQIGIVGRDLNEIMATASGAAEKAKTITSSLVSIETDMSAVDVGTREILVAANEIAGAITQVKTGVDQISAAAQQADKAASEAAMVAKQQSQASEQLSAAVEEIASLADELQSA